MSKVEWLKFAFWLLVDIGIVAYLYHRVKLDDVKRERTRYPLYSVRESGVVAEIIPEHEKQEQQRRAEALGFLDDESGPYVA